HGVAGSRGQSRPSMAAMFATTTTDAVVSACVPTPPPKLPLAVAMVISKERAGRPTARRYRHRRRSNGRKRAEHLAERLRAALPDFRVRRLLLQPDEWKHSGGSPLVWRELVGRGGRGLLLGGLDDFLQHCQEYYGVVSDMSSEMALKIAAENREAEEKRKEEVELQASLLQPIHIWIAGGRRWRSKRRRWEDEVKEEKREVVVEKEVREEEKGEEEEEEEVKEEKVLEKEEEEVKEEKVEKKEEEVGAEKEKDGMQEEEKKVREEVEEKKWRRRKAGEGEGGGEGKREGGGEGEVREKVEEKEEQVREKVEEKDEEGGEEEKEKEVGEEEEKAKEEKEEEREETRREKELLRRLSARYRRYGQLIGERANRQRRHRQGVAVLVAGDAHLNLKCALLAENAPSVDPRCFVAVATPLESAARASVAQKLGRRPADVTGVRVWGNLSGVFHVDLQSSRVFHHVGAIQGPPLFSRPVLEVLQDRNWLKTDLPALVSGRRGATESKTQGPTMTAAAAASSMSIAHGILTVLKAWNGGSRCPEQGEEEEAVVLSLGVCCQGHPYVPNGVVCSIPVTFSEGVWSPVLEGVHMEGELRETLEQALDQLRWVKLLSK
ncbi:hypothetical protein CRUP_009070, partial [Coryphaenoides rupestris]